MACHPQCHCDRCAQLTLQLTCGKQAKRWHCSAQALHDHAHLVGSHVLHQAVREYAAEHAAHRVAQGRSEGQEPQLLQRGAVGLHEERGNEAIEEGIGCPRREHPKEDRGDQRLAQPQQQLGAVGAGG